LASGVFLAVVAALILVWPVWERPSIAPHLLQAMTWSPTALSDAQFQPPAARHWFGTDVHGRDLLSRVFYGARVSLLIGVGGVGIAVLLGMFIGVTAGWYSGVWDEILMRLMDGLSAFPGLLLALSLVAITGSTVLNIILVVGIVGTPWVARVIRSQVLSLREREFIIAVRGLGASSGRIMLKHLLPNCLAPVIVQASLAVAAAILLEAALSFLGVGVKPPTPTWGGMLRHAFETVSQAPWLTVSPGVMIFLVVLAFNFFGDALRDVLDPRLRGTR